jgi:hypothetical protein
MDTVAVDNIIVSGTALITCCYGNERPALCRLCTGRRRGDEDRKLLEISEGNLITAPVSLVWLASSDWSRKA